jgi:tetratricopeptide (TPR) repeat protein
LTGKALGLGRFQPHPRDGSWKFIRRNNSSNPVIEETGGGHMKIRSALFRVTLALGIVISLPAGMAAQKGGKGGPPSKPSANTNISPTSSSQPISTQPLFISGKVLLDGSGAPPEPVLIERVCNGVARRQGYTDSRGSFQFQLDQVMGFQDASENSGMAGNDFQTSIQAQDNLNVKYQGCEIRAVLPGFLSSAVSLRVQGSTRQYDLGTIFLKRMENVTGATISMTTLSAPGDAKRAYEKARKAFDEKKFLDAEKELEKAVKIYPSFAAAWSLLGDIHQQQKQLELAVKDYGQALAADPQFVNPHFGLALIAIQEKRWQDAVQFTNEVLKMNPSAFPSAYFYNAVASFNLGRVDSAEASARKFKSLDTDHRHPDICLLLGQIFVQKRDFASAAQEMRDYLALVPSASNAQEVRDTLKRLEDAIAATKH